MEKSNLSNPLFRVITKRNPKAQKMLFYLTSYAFPWWIYAPAIARFRRLGYEVAIYEFHNEILENDNPQVLPATITAILDDMQSRRHGYEAKGIKIFHGIGNSLGSYILFNYTQHYHLKAIVLNGGGSMADIIFHKNKGSWQKIASDYIHKGYDLPTVKKLWARFDAPEHGKKIKADRILITHSLNDGTIPLASTQALVANIQSSCKNVTVKLDHLPHIYSIIFNALRVKKTL